MNRYIDEDQLVINLKKQDPDLKWPDIMESWESLSAGSMQLLKGTSIYIVGDSTDVNQKVARELAVALGYFIYIPPIQLHTCCSFLIIDCLISFVLIVNLHPFPACHPNFSR